MAKLNFEDFTKKETVVPATIFIGIAFAIPLGIGLSGLPFIWVAQALCAICAVMSIFLFFVGAFRSRENRIAQATQSVRRRRHRAHEPL